ncbi:hypothetical protein [Ruegeria atlantica]|uniref:hypothetical protein n=1 Tax=Ruegeria atlantica TaxID=81569 RepID=UPI00147DC4D0|nr:hypothetical protein [Ruegeria atlantica]
MQASNRRRELSAIKVRQWLNAWDEIQFSKETRRRKPDSHFFIFSIPAKELRSLCGIHRRSANLEVDRNEDLGIQRQHDEERSEEISRFVEYGYPWSTISQAKRSSPDYDDLRKPGWLPTSVVINIIPKGEKRFGVAVDDKHVVSVSDEGGVNKVVLPYSENEDDWSPKGLHPVDWRLESRRRGVRVRRLSGLVGYGEVQDSEYREQENLFLAPATTRKVLSGFCSDARRWANLGCRIQGRASFRLGRSQAPD